MIANKKVILFELNEVPYRILDEYVRKHPKSAMAKFSNRSMQAMSYAVDDGHLSPWKTWPTLHRGSKDHGITDFNQDLTEANQICPSIWTKLHHARVRTGVFGSLHSYPMPKDYSSYSFYVPDPFAKLLKLIPFM